MLISDNEGGVAKELLQFGAPAFAYTPDHFPGLMAAAIDRRDFARWAAEQGIAFERASESPT